MLQLLNTISPFCHVLFGAICHDLLFVMFSLAPYLSLPGNHLGCDSLAQKGGKSGSHHVAAQQVAPTCPKRMEFARHMVELEFANFMDVHGIYFSPECANVIPKTQLFGFT